MWGCSLPSVSIQLHQMLQNHDLSCCTGCCPKQFPPCSSPGPPQRNPFPFLNAQLGFATCPGSTALLSLPSFPKFKMHPSPCPKAQAEDVSGTKGHQGSSLGEHTMLRVRLERVSAPTLRLLLRFFLITGLTGSEEARAQSHLSILDPLRVHFPHHSYCPEGPTGTKRACCTLQQPDRLCGDLNGSENIFEIFQLRWFCF